MKVKIFALFLAVFGVLACQKATQQSLPILGNRDVVDGDTIYPTIRDFSFLNQDSQVVTNKLFEGKAYVIDFFFVSCPTICPKVTKQMRRVYDRFKSDDRVLLVGHTVDPKHDTFARLQKHAKNLDIDTRKWMFLTGEKDSIYSIAADYFSVASEDTDAAGGFNHSGRLILVDKKRHVRAFCDGTTASSVDSFMVQIDQLLQEEYSKN